MSIPSTKDRLRDLILDALKTNYIAHSCKDNIETGNHYQSIKLGDMQTTGFRTDRRTFLERINFRGKKVLDLGSNLGEISRIARERGAYLVDGFEYDPFFVEIARAITAYNEMTRVSFYRCDITRPSAYTEHYDIVLAFAVFEYIRNVLDQIAQITDRLFILETHRLDDNLESEYLGPILQRFPHYRMLGDTEWGVPHGEGVRRAVIAFARSEAEFSLVKGLTRAQPGLILDPDASDAAAGVAPRLTRTGSTTVDTVRTPWLDRFFTAMSFESPDDLLAAVAAMELDLDRMMKNRDLQLESTSGWLYWVLFIKGYLQYEQNGGAAYNTTYREYLTRYFGPQGEDPGIGSLLADPNGAAERATLRYKDFERFRAARASGATELTVDPIQLFVRTPPSEDAKPLFLANSETPVLASVDGYHRLFLARLFGVRQLACDVLVEEMVSSS